MPEKTFSVPEEHLKNIFGELDSNLKLIEKALSVEVVTRNGLVHIIGEDGGIDAAEGVFRELFLLSENGSPVDTQKVTYALSLAAEKKVTGREGNGHTIAELDSDIICHTISGKPISPKTLGQKEYVDAIRKNMVVFSIGPAGTGKTYLAMALACYYFGRGDCERIILTRPAIEAGEKLGFLPGDLQSKVDPYLRPLYDALFQIMGQEAFQRNMEKGVIEVAPLAYMRGRTLDNSFIILDEAQNTTSAQMKMFLTRIGFGSKVVVTGDLTQKDLSPEVSSGLEVAERVLSKVEGIAFKRLSGKDVVRHPLVQKIVNAYEEYEKKSSDAGKRGSGNRGKGGRK